jgi:hypothetical protein
MVRKSRSLSKRSRDSVPVYDVKTKKVVVLGREEVEEQIDELYEKMLRVLSRIERLGKYQLQDIEISIGFTAGVFVVTLEGGIVLRYSSYSADPYGTPWGKRRQRSKVVMAGGEKSESRTS